MVTTEARRQAEKGTAEERLHSTQGGEAAQSSLTRARTTNPRPSGDNLADAAFESRRASKRASDFTSSAGEPRGDAGSPAELWYDDVVTQATTRDACERVNLRFPARRLTEANMPHSKTNDEAQALEQESKMRYQPVETDELEIVRFPRVMRSSLHGSLASHSNSASNRNGDNHGNSSSSQSSGSRGYEAGYAVENPASPTLTKKGRALLGILGDTVLQDDAVLQEHVRVASAGPIRRSLRSAGSGVPAPPLGARKSKRGKKGIVGEEAAGEKVKGEEEKGEEKEAVEVEEEEEEEDDDEEETEDIVALLRWLADLREKRLLTQDRFRRAVECIRVNTKVPFFLCEGSRAGEAPTLMVRLPQTADEAVTVPLLGAPLNMGEVRQRGEEEGGCGLHPQREGLNVVRGVAKTGAESSRQKLPWVQKTSSGEAGEADAMRRYAGPVRTLHNGVPLLPVIQDKLQRGHFQENIEASLSVGTANKYMSCPQSPLEGRGVLRVSSGQPLAGVSDSITGPLPGSNAQQASSLHESVRRARQSLLTAFDPAMPKETSPYNKTPRTAAFIAVGTKNFMA
ncbi:uncharacterized protein Tco025E_03771 [Trypanosoma conorhini]|uniref:Uncharacterized protein n=1 Tax=Trypanosoma conorhini TaxID=83891 RepID=A0A422PRT6_9TRYP|nr:uncharacterized protein Tco025E_03771 [Trypanosoma conorhini]RNF20413.1 hypothetical protein Tco025E_03771 [Trypanosoma conorhini]